MSKKVVDEKGNTTFYPDDCVETKVKSKAEAQAKAETQAKAEAQAKAK